MVLGCDVSGDGQYPGLPWNLWYEFGIRFAFIKTSEGLHADRYFAQHHNQAQMAGVWTMEYHALVPDIPGRDQALFFMGRWPRGWRGPAVVDVELSGTARILYDFCQEWLLVARRPLMIYTGPGAWMQIVGGGQTFFRQFMLWIAGGSAYNQHVAAPPNERPAVPDIWAVPKSTLAVGSPTDPPRGFAQVSVTGLLDPPNYDFWQFTGKGRLPGYDGDIDIDVYPYDWLTLGALWLSFGDGPMDDTQIGTCLNELAKIQASIDVMRAALVPAPPPPPPPAKHTMAAMTNQAVLEAQLSVAQKSVLYGQRLALYTGPAVEDMPTLSAAQQAAIIAALPAAG